MERRVQRPGCRPERREVLDLDQANDLLDQTANLSCSGPLLSSSVPAQKQLGKINHIVVIYEENHSFDNLFGGWEGVNGLADADAAHTTQLAQSGAALPWSARLTDVNLADAAGVRRVRKRTLEPVQGTHPS